MPCHLGVHFTEDKVRFLVQNLPLLHKGKFGLPNFRRRISVFLSESDDWRQAQMQGLIAA